MSYVNRKALKPWTYDNEQWTKLPSYLRHLPLFTRNTDWMSIFFRILWSFILQDICFKLYVRLKVKGTTFKSLYRDYPKLILISNHASHLDATSIAAAVPRRYWTSLYIAAAKDYFFSNPFFAFFSKHCLGAIPIDRKDRRGEAINLTIHLLRTLPRMWLIWFPEGTRSQDGKIHDFKRGVSIFSEQTKTPILFLYIDGNTRLWPKGKAVPKPGSLTVHVGPVQQPGPIKDVYASYKQWVKTIAPDSFADDVDDLEKTNKAPTDTSPTSHGEDF